MTSAELRFADINLARLHQMGIVPHGGGRKHGNLIVVTSALPGEGKTFCAINLAMSIAMEQDQTVRDARLPVRRRLRPLRLNCFNLDRAAAAGPSPVPCAVQP